MYILCEHVCESERGVGGGGGLEREREWMEGGVGESVYFHDEGKCTRW